MDTYLKVVLSWPVWAWHLVEIFLNVLRSLKDQVLLGPPAPGFYSCFFIWPLKFEFLANQVRFYTVDSIWIVLMSLFLYNVFLTNQHYARTLNVSGYMLEIKDIPGARITGRVSKKKSLFLWQGQNLCGLSLAFIIDWRVVSSKSLINWEKSF